MQLWSSYPFTVLSSHTRSQKSIQEYGHNMFMCWSPTDQEVAIATSKGFVLFVNVKGTTPAYKLKCTNVRDLVYKTVREGVVFENKCDAQRPGTAVISHTITAMASTKDELLVATSAVSASIYILTPFLKWNFIMGLSNVRADVNPAAFIHIYQSLQTSR